MRFNIATLIFACALSAQAQGSFQNLNFEQSHPVSVGNPLEPGLVTTASALPQWTVSYGGSQQTQMFYNSIATGGTQVTLIGPNTSVGYVPIDGNYSVLLQGGLTASTASISQTGLIPAGTQSLLVDAQPPNPAVQGPLELQIGTQLVPLMAVGSGANYTLYGANVAAWAGDTEQLTFSALEGYGGGDNWLIDDISFSTTAVPEPSPSIVTGVGGLFFVLYRRSSKR